MTFVEENIDAHRARSLRERLEQEDVLRDRAWERPILGWGRWGRSRVFDDSGQFAVMTDGLWVIIFGSSGLLGVMAWQGASIVPAFLIFWRIRGRQIASQHYGPVVALSLCVVLYTLDCLLNAMLNPVLHLTMGALAGSAMHFPRFRQAELIDIANARGRIATQSNPVVKEPVAVATEAVGDFRGDSRSNFSKPQY